MTAPLTPLDRHAGLAGTSVLEDVIDAFLHHPVEVDLRLFGQHAIKLVKHGGEARPFGGGDFLEHGFDGFSQTEPVEVVGAKVVSDLAHFINGLRGGLRNLIQLLGSAFLVIGRG